MCFQFAPKLKTQHTHTGISGTCQLTLVKFEFGNIITPEDST